MITTKITIKPHLAEYNTRKYNACELGPIRFPDRDDLYHTVFSLTEKRPNNCPVDSGNLELVLPERREGKSPLTFNYLGYRSVKIIEKKIETRLWAELHDLIDENKHFYGIQYIESVAYFMRKYAIVSISEDALLKNYYRWREIVRQKKRRRSYQKREL